MTTLETRFRHLPPLDDPWRRMAWLLPAAIMTWAMLLVVFARLLEQSAPPPPELKPIEARIVEVPTIGGLQGGGGAAVPSVRPQPKPVVKAPPRAHPAPRPKAAVPLPPSAEGTLRHKAKASSAESPAASGGAKSTAPSDESPDSGAEPDKAGGGSGGGAGPGTDSSGARAIYSPAPVIPDDLREDVIQTEAVASFKVSADGNVTVSLSTPTPNPRLNQILLDTLRQWKFFPATRDGIAIDAAFDLRIPIAVQ